MSSLQNLLAELRNREVRVWVDGDRLRFSGPKGALTPELRDEMAARKPEIIAFLSRVQTAKSDARPTLRRLPRDQPLPLSFAQERVWFLDQLEGKSPEYNIPAALRLEGTLDVDALSRSLIEIVRRHEVLRASFPVVGGNVAQIIAQEADFRLPVVDLSQLPVVERGAEARRLTDLEMQTPFDLATGPLMRGQLLRLTPDSHLLLLTMHHIVSDGWSMGVLVAELGAIYSAFCQGLPSPLAELSVQYADFAKWQREWLEEGELEKQLDYWKRQLAGVPALLKLPTDRARPAIQGFLGSMEHFEIDAELTRRLKKLSDESSVTLYMTLMAAFVVLLSRYSGERDIVIGTPIANRSMSEVERLIGFFVNTLLIRSQITGEMKFSDLLASVRQTALDAYSHQDLPFEKLVAELQPPRSLSYSPLFQVMFVMQNAPVGKPELQGLREASLEMDVNVVRCDLTLSIEESDARLKGLWTYKPALFDASTIERLSARFHHLLESIVRSPEAVLIDLETDRQIELPSLTPPDRLPMTDELSYHQERLWFIDRFEKGSVYESSPTYHNLPLIIHFSEAIDASLLEKSVNAVVARHEALRTRIELDGDRPLQRVLPALHVTLEVEDLTGAEASFDFREAGRGQALPLQVAIAESQRPFELEGEPLLRARLFKLTEDELGNPKSKIQNPKFPSLFVLTVHHIIADQGSLDVIARDLLDAYSRFAAGSDEGFASDVVQYRQVARSEREIPVGETEALLLHWKPQLGGRLQPLELPVDRPRPSIHTFTAALRSFTFDTGLVEGIRRIANELGVSPKVISLAAFQILLHRYARQDEIVVGISHSGRESGTLKNTVGPVANLLVIRSSLEVNPAICQVVQGLNGTLQRAERHRALPFDRLVRELKPENDMSRTALFDVLFQYQEARDPSLIEALRCANATVIDTNLGLGKYDLNLLLKEDNDSINGRLVFNTDLFDDYLIDQFIGHFRAALEAMSRSATVGIDEFSLLNAEEESQQLNEWNDTATGYPVDRTIHQLFTEQAIKRGDAVAVVCGISSLTYLQLEERSNQLAHFLKARGVGRDTLVGVCLERSVEMIVALMGILKAGGAYLPLDPAHPAPRLAFVIEDSKIDLVLTTSALAGVVAGSGAHVTACDIDDDEIRRMSVIAPDCDSRPDSLAYCIYTSGSTGKPKGVLIEHRNVVRLLVNDSLPFAFDEHDSWTMFHSFGFDFSVWEIFGALLYGGRLVIVSAEVTKDPIQFIELLARERVTVLNQTPTAFYALAREAVRSAPADLALRYVIFGGEALQPAQLREWRDAYPGTRLINMFGITETTVHVTFKEIGPLEIDGNIGSIGRPIPTTTTYVMDSRQRLLPVGVAGELCVGGAGVGRGYLNRDQLTLERFIANPYREGERLYRSGDLARLRPDGELLYLGRGDDQVQIRGFRVEPGEIRHRLLRHPLVADAIVVARDGGVYGAELVAYIVPKRAVEAMRVRERNGSNARRYRLPNGLEIFHLNQNETAFLYDEIFAEAAYLKHGVTLRSGDCVFDVGANIGLFTLFAGQTKDVSIYSFEPIPSTFDVLRGNAEMYGINARLFPCGLGSESREEVFTHYPHVSIFSGRFAVPKEEQKIIKSFVEHQQKAASSTVIAGDEIDELISERMGTEQVTCQMRTLSDVISEQRVERIDLLKIDVEKSEVDLLAGIEPDDWEKIEQIVMEVHNVDQRLDDIRSLIESHGFTVNVEQDEWFEDTSNYNLYAVRPRREQRGMHAPEALVPLVKVSTDELADDVRADLRRSLPDYMIPSVFVVLERVPLTANGKVDIRALPAPDAVTAQFGRALIEPRTPIEGKLHEIWKEVLGIDRISVDDNFFEVGGHSLLATQVISRLRDRLSVSLPVRVLFESPTIAGLAAAVETAASTQDENEEPALVRLSRRAQSPGSLGLRRD